MSLIKFSASVAVSMLVISFMLIDSGDAGASHRNSDEKNCRCRARVSIQEPMMRYDSSGQLVLTPVVDVRIRTRGDFDAPEWTALLAYGGKLSYSSRDDVSIPDGHSFEGSKEIMSGFCGLDYDWEGVQLEEVLIPGLTSAMLEDDERLQGEIMSHATLSVCDDVDDDHDRERFRLEGPYKIKV